MLRILSHILIGGIYHPPAAKHTDTIAYILEYTGLPRRGVQTPSRAWHFANRGL